MNQADFDAVTAASGEPYAVSIRDRLEELATIIRGRGEPIREVRLTHDATRNLWTLTFYPKHDNRAPRTWQSKNLLDVVDLAEAEIAMRRTYVLVPDSDPLRVERCHCGQPRFVTAKGSDCDNGHKK